MNYDEKQLHRATAKVREARRYFERGEAARALTMMHSQIIGNGFDGKPALQRAVKDVQQILVGHIDGSTPKADVDFWFEALAVSIRLDVPLGGAQEAIEMYLEDKERELARKARELESKAEALRDTATALYHQKRCLRRGEPLNGATLRVEGLRAFCCVLKDQYPKMVAEPGEFI